MHILDVQLPTADPAALRPFYTDTLGLPLLREEPGTLAVQAGATRLTFTAAEGGAPTHHFAFNIPRDALASAKGWLSGRADLLTQDGADEFASEAWDARQVYFFDPAGNILELIARQGMPDEADGPFGPRHILNVSEVGLPTGDVPAVVAALGRDLGLPPYQDQSDTFSAVGDERGLLIVVKAGRHWFPTTTAAAVAPLAITIAGARAGEYRLPGLPYHIAVVTR
jgi:catechol-2,3-dioxygenase